MSMPSVTGKHRAPLGVYVHFPFCARRCRYCDFPTFEKQMHRRKAYMDAVLREMASRVEGRPWVNTVFVGGGTPSLMQAEEVKRLFDAVFHHFDVDAAAEITMEANPNAVSDAFLQAAVSSGVNRLSLGVQAVQPRLLRLLGRSHSKEQVAQAVKRIRAQGVDNINLDFLLGVPEQTMRDVEETVDFALGLGVPHLSFYGLIVEENTPLRADVALGRLTLPEAEQERAMYGFVRSALREHGILQYEISNFARPGREARHNLGTWKRHNYMGFGLAAASLEHGDLRRANAGDLAGYMAGQAPEEEIVAPKEQMFETMMLGLRMTAGVDKEQFYITYGKRPEQVYPKAIRRHTAAGLLRDSAARLALTEAGMDLMNRVLVDLMDEST